jgi:lipoprotein-anchoring transpeptidase ErfK/SrfK
MWDWNQLAPPRAALIVAGFAASILLAASGGALIASSGHEAPVVAKPAAVPPAPRPVPAKAPAPPAPAVPEPLIVKRVLPIDGPIRFGDYHWDSDGVPADGPLVITVDLEAQTLSVFRDGYEIGATAILYGADSNPTPLGQHVITQKKVHHISNLYGAPMPYMMRLTNDGVAIHASDIKQGLATHGCIGVPLPFAKLLFAQAKLGDRVIITRGKRLGLGGAITG